MKSKKLKGFSFFEDKVKLSLDYIKESKSFIYVAISIFFLFSILGFFVPLPQNLSNEILQYFRSLVLETKGFGVFEMILFLFSNNSVSGFMGLFFGFFFGIFPILNAILNGFILGFAAMFSVSEGGILSLWRLFPHGIFELPAIFISLGLGIKFSTFIFKKKKFNSFKEYFEKSFWSYITIILPLLVIAAIIEGILIVLGI